MADPRRRRSRLLALAAGLQAGCGLLLLVDMLSEISEIRKDVAHGILEIAILVSLVLGSALIAGEFRRMQAAGRQMEGRIRLASGAFVEVMEESFAGWGLTPAEREVAFLTIKGFSVDEIAGLRDARPGTVRAQSTAVYRKAGVSSRAQLLSHFIDGLLVGDGLAPPRAAAKE